MQGLEEYISRNIWQFVGFGVVIIAQLYIANKINPIKKTVGKIESSEEKQWMIIDDMREQLNKLQGAHDAINCGRKK